MSWADFSAMLVDAAQQPILILLCAMLIVAAALVAGVMAREQETDWGDTQALPEFTTAQGGEAVDTGRLQWLTPDEATPLANPDMQTRRVRAIGTDLQPSYDGRQADRQ